MRETSLCSKHGPWIENEQGCPGCVADALGVPYLGKLDDGRTPWHDAQQYEAGWWGSCVNTYAEEQRQIEEALMMELEPTITLGPYRFPVIDLEGRSVVDVGSGPVSLLLKCVNLGSRWPTNGSAVLDPCPYPEWVWMRYREHGLLELRMRGEDLGPHLGHWDEAWITNVLQHVVDPEACVRAARSVADVVRVFEWVDVPAYEGHPHCLKAWELDRWLGGRGSVVWWEQYRKFAYVGVFAGREEFEVVGGALPRVELD